jgi:hypothetical protein
MNYYKDNGQRRYYIVKKTTQKENKENMLKVFAYCCVGWFLFYGGLFLFLHLLEL